MLLSPWTAGTTCPHPCYPAFEAKIRQASFNFAGSGVEHAHGYNRVREAADIVIENRLPVWAIKRMLKDINSLVDFDLLMQKVLENLYERGQS